ncbi:MerR family transcriptional regulator [uncultured Phascolarctobacterium sp.]|uniref:MerR family transcriptional regulator n=1 Tax=uncultured Phascolarctobacterium sp. TaxID=512296 RepID=UPI00262ED006|nr:MerR family transcriptional regulator [uncultured Phascolarctobacterium sp.]
MTIKEVSEKYNISADTLRYYERVGMIPAVRRTSGGIRNYGEEECGWIELEICMRSAGLTIDTMIKYVQLYQQGDATIKTRLDLLIDQKAKLVEQQKKITQTLQVLDYKIGRYQIALASGHLSW